MRRWRAAGAVAVLTLLLGLLPTPPSRAETNPAFERPTDDFLQVYIDWVCLTAGEPYNEPYGERVNYTWEAVGRMVGGAWSAANTFVFEYANGSTQVPNAWHDSIEISYELLHYQLRGKAFMDYSTWDLDLRYQGERFPPLRKVTLWVRGFLDPELRQWNQASAVVYTAEEGWICRSLNPPPAGPSSRLIFSVLGLFVGTPAAVIAAVRWAGGTRPSLWRRTGPPKLPASPPRH